MRIILVLKNSIESLPPIHYLLTALNNTSIKVDVICLGISNYNKNQLNRINFIHSKPLPSSKFINLKFRKIIKSKVNLNDYNTIWIGTPGSGIPLLFSILNRKYILHCHELYNDSFFSKNILKLLLKYSNGFIAPTLERIFLIKGLYKINKRSFLWPNRPIQNTVNLALGNDVENLKFQSIIEKLKSKKTILYQGGVNPARNLDVVIKAMNDLGDEWQFAILSPNEKNSYFKEIIKNDSVIHIPYISPPFHLIITKYCYMGILNYKPVNLNNSFCAPNKIWEYAMFGLPMIGNIIPGLITPFETFKIGELINFEEKSSSDFVNAAKEIDNNYKQYSQNCISFYRSINVVDLANNIFRN